MRFRYLVLLAVLLSLAACETVRFGQAEELYKKGRYAGAIQELDSFIRSANNGALKTRAQILRAAAYNELGLTAKERQNWPLAIKLFKISNSEAADQSLAEIYMLLAKQAESNGDHQTTMDYLNLILREIPGSSLIAELLYKKIQLYQSVYLDYESAWRDYRFLYDNYPDNPYELQARNYAERLIPARIDYALTLSGTAYYSEALGLLFEMDRYPVVDHTQIQRLISDVYQAQAEDYLLSEQYLEADNLFRIALQYNPDKASEINARLASITGFFIQEGDKYLAARDFENALLYYNKSFEIIPDYQPGLEAIARLNQVKLNIARAQEIARTAEEAEAGRRYADAARLYGQAAGIENEPQYREKQAIMQNLVEAERDPEGFTQRVINQYKGGILGRKIRQKIAELGTRYRQSEIRDSGWKILLSTGQHKYEARYDILTPQETFFYIWQVNLRDRSIVPLNRISEELMQ